MSYKQLREAIARRRSKDVDAPISGTGGELTEGTHTVVISGVDLTALESDGRVTLVFEDDSRGYHNERLWLYSSVNGRQEISRKFEFFLAALFLDPEALDAVLDGMATETVGLDTFNCLRGLRLNISVSPGPGYRVHLTETGRYTVVNARGDRPMMTKARFSPIPQEFGSIAEARGAASAAGLRRSYNRVYKYEAVDDNVAATNKECFGRAFESIKTAKTRGDNGKSLDASDIEELTTSGTSTDTGDTHS